MFSEIASIPFELSDVKDFFRTEGTQSKAKPQKPSEFDKLVSRVFDYLLETKSGHRIFEYKIDWDKTLDFQIIKPISTNSNPAKPTLIIYDRHRVQEAYELPIINPKDREESLDELANALNKHIKSHLTASNRSLQKALIEAA